METQVKSYDNTMRFRFAVHDIFVSHKKRGRCEYINNLLKFIPMIPMDLYSHKCFQNFHSTKLSSGVDPL